MDLLSILNNKALKATEKRREIIIIFQEDTLTEDALMSLCSSLNKKQLTLIMEAIEEITRKDPELVKPIWLTLARPHILSENNSLRRETARVTGNLAARFPDDMKEAIPALLENTKNSGTVIRWANAYALAQIICLPQYAVTSLYDTLIEICENEQDNGVKNQYLKGLKKAQKSLGK